MDIGRTCLCGNSIIDPKNDYSGVAIECADGSFNLCDWCYKRTKNMNTKKRTVVSVVLELLVEEFICLREQVDTNTSSIENIQGFSSYDDYGHKISN